MTETYDIRDRSELLHITESRDLFGGEKDVRKAGFSSIHFGTTYADRQSPEMPLLENTRTARRAMGIDNRRIGAPRIGGHR